MGYSLVMLKGLRVFLPNFEYTSKIRRDMLIIRNFSLPRSVLPYKIRVRVRLCHHVFHLKDIFGLTYL